MADNTQLNTGTGGDIISTDVITTLNGGGVATGEKAQRVKVGWGVDATFNDANASQPLPVVQTGTPGLPTGAATAGNQATANTLLGNIDTSTAASKTDLDAIAGAVSGGKIKTQVTDTQPATQNITVVDSGSTTNSGANSQSIITGTPTAASAATFALSGQDSVFLQISGTWTGTLQSEVSMDGGTTWYIAGFHQRGTNYTVATVTANASGIANIAGCTHWRMRATAAMTGTATIGVSETANPSTIYLANSATISDPTTPTQKLAVSAAGAAKVDGSAVTQPVSAVSLPLPTGAALDASLTTIDTDLKSNITLHAGTNIVGKVTTDQTTHGTTDLVAADITKIGGSALAFGQAAMAASIPVTFASNQSALPASQSGTWTVQPGNTANTTAWLVNQGNVTPVIKNALTNAASSVNSSAATILEDYYIWNPNATVAYVQIFDVATAGAVTLGVTTPKWSIGIPPTSAANVSRAGISMANGLQVAATTTATGASALASAVDANFGYR